MARRKTPTVRVRVLASFNGMHRGDEADVELNVIVQGWVNANLVEVVDGGKDPVGQGGTEPHDPGGVQVGAGGSGPAGDEPGQSFGSGGYGSSAS